MLEGHGNDWHKYKGKLKKDFSSNVWFQGPPKLLMNHLEFSLPKIANYPEPSAQTLSKQVCEYYHLPTDSALITNGSVEAFYLIAKLFNGKSSTVITPAFAEYEDAALQFNHQVIYRLSSSLNDDSTFESDMVWLGNPNNPDGKITSLPQIENWLKIHPKITFVIDEAYADFCLEFDSVIPLISKYKNLVVVKSFTKSFAIPGLRLGMLLSNNKIITSLKQHLPPWSVNSLAQSAGSFILKNHKQLIFDRPYMHQLSQHMQSQLVVHNKLEVLPSQTNYFLCKSLAGSAQLLKEYLMDEHGFLIRNADNFEGLSSHHFRIAIQDENSNNSLVKAIFQWLG